VEGRHRRPPDHRRRRAAEKEQGPGHPGWAKVIDGKTVEVGDTRIQCEHLVLATGSSSVNLPMLPIGGPIISSTEALAPKAVPKRLVVVGGGYIGLELGIAYRKLGAEVSVVEAQDASCRPTTPS
jgi:dihydrolipoamide dehydrogenase